MSRDIPVNHDNINSIREILITCNKATELCFNKCTTNFDHRALTPEEDSCFESCSTKFISSSEVIMHTFMEIQTKKKQIMEASLASEGSNILNLSSQTPS